MKVDKIGTQPLDPNVIFDQAIQPAAETKAGQENAKEAKEAKESKPASNLEKVFARLGNVLSGESTLPEEEFGLLTIPVSEASNEGAYTNNVSAFLSKAFALLNATDTLTNAFYPAMANNAAIPSASTVEVSMGGMAASQSMDALIQGLMARADFLEQILNMTPTPENADDPMLPLIRALLGILQKYGVAMDNLTTEIQKNKSKSSFVLMPDANTKDGLSKTITVS